MSVKILHLINGEFYAGAERVQDLLATNLPAFGYHCDFVCLKSGRFISSRRSTASSVYLLEMKSKCDFSIISKLVKIIRDGQYKIVHTHTARSALIGRIACTRSIKSMVHHLHSPTKDDTENKFRNYINAIIERFSLHRVSKIIPVSESLGRYALECGFDKSKIHVIPNGVPVGNIQTPWEKLPGPWVLGVVALFRPRKGLEILFNAA